MKKESFLKICVLGGQSFGKTTLQASLIIKGGDAKSGITVSGDNTKMLKIFNDYKNNDGKLPATSWKDICKFNYHITAEDQKKWNVSFVDYPGEFFQKCFAENDNNLFRGFISMFGQGNKEQGNSATNNFTFTKEDLKQARKLQKEFLSADALIVLLPADITSDAYKVNLGLFMIRLQSFMEKIRKINPYIPVCLAINKWDMFDKEYSEIDAILEESPYADFNTMFKRELGEQYFCMPISAFGGNKFQISNNCEGNTNDKDEWDGKSKPVNVLDMLLKLSDMAEIAKYKLLREKYAKANIISKTLSYPFTLGELYHRGANSEDDRKFCSCEFRKCSLYLIYTIAIITLLAYLGAGSFSTLREMAYLHKQKASLDEVLLSFKANENDNTTAQAIDGFKKAIAHHPRTLAYFCNNRVEEINTLIATVEKEYNQRIYNIALKCLETYETRDESPRTSRPDTRLERSEERKRIFEHAKANLTDMIVRIDGRTLENLLKEKIDQEISKQDNIKKDKDFYDKLFDLGKSTTNNRCKAIEDFLIEFRNTKNHLSSIMDELYAELEKYEQEYHDKLMTDLDSPAYQDLPESKDCQARIDLAQKRIDRITAEKNNLSIGSKWHQPHNTLVQNANKLIEQLNYDKPFYDDLKALREDLHKTDKNKIRLLKNFLALHDKETFPRCEKDIEMLNQECDQLIKDLKDNFTKILEANSITKGLTAAEKITRIEALIKAYNSMLEQYPVENDKWRNQSLQSRAQLFLDKDKYTKEIPFETQFSKIKESLPEGKLKLIQDFENTFSKEEYQDRVDDYNQLSTWKNELVEKWKKEIKENAVLYNYNESLPWATRKSNAEKMLAVYLRILPELITIPEKHSDIQAEKSKLEKTLENDEHFYADLELMRTDVKKAPNNKINLIGSFIANHPIESYKNCSQDILALTQERDTLIAALKKELQANLKANEIKEGMTASEKIRRIDNIVPVYTSTLAQYPYNDDWRKQTEVQLTQLKLDKQKYNSELPFEEKYLAIKKAVPEGKLKLIQDFLGNFSKEEYKDKQNEFKQIERWKVDLIQHWKKILADNEDKLKDNANDSWADRKANADNLLNVYKDIAQELTSVPIEYDILQNKIRTLTIKSEEINRYKQLDDDFAQIQTGSPYMILKSAIAFVETHKENEYQLPAGQEIFKNVKQIIQTQEKNIYENFNKEITAKGKLDSTDFVGSIAYFSSCFEITQKYLFQVDKKSELHEKILQLKNEYEQQRNKFILFNQIATATPVVREEEKIEDVKIAREKLLATKIFLSEFPLKDHRDIEIKSIYDNIAKIQSRCETVIVKFLDSQLEEITRNLPPDATADDIMTASNKKISILREYTPYMVDTGDNRIFRKYKDMMDSEESQLDTTRAKKLFTDEYEKLQRDLRQYQAAADKVALIAAFRTDFDTPKYRKQFPQKLSDLESQQGHYTTIVEFRKLERGISATIAKRPPTGAQTEDFLRYKEAIAKSKVSLNKYSKEGAVLKDVQTLEQKITDELKYITTSLGDGSITNIKQKLEIYKTTPDDNNRREVRRAMDSFNPIEYATHLKEKEELQKDFEKDIKLYEDMLDAYRHYASDTNYNTFVTFQSKTNALNIWCNGNENSTQKGYGTNYPILNVYLDYIGKIKQGYQIKIFYSSSNFSEKWKKVEFELKIKDKTVINNTAYNTNFNGHIDMVKETIPFGESLKCTPTFYNINSYGNDKNRPTSSVDYWEILHNGMSSGHYYHSFRFTIREDNILWYDAETFTGEIKFYFTEIPCIK